MQRSSVFWPGFGQPMVSVHHQDHVRPTRRPWGLQRVRECRSPPLPAGANCRDISSTKILSLRVHELAVHFAVSGRPNRVPYRWDSQIERADASRAW